MDFRLKETYINKPKGHVFENLNFQVGSKLARDGVGEWVTAQDEPKPDKVVKTIKKKATSKKKAEK